MNIFLLIHSSAFVVSGFLIKHLNLSVESILMIDQECVILSNNNFKLLNNYKPSRYLRTFLYSHSQVPLKLLCSSVSILSWNTIDIANQQMIYTDLNNYICVQFPKHEYLTWEWTSSSHSRIVRLRSHNPHPLILIVDLRRQCFSIPPELVKIPVQMSPATLSDLLGHTIRGHSRFIVNDSKLKNYCYRSLSMNDESPFM